MLKILAVLLLSGLAFGAGNQTATQSVTITVKTVTPLVITPPVSIPNIVIINGVVQPYAGATFTVGGGTPPYVWTVSSGNLPAGLTLATSGTNGVNGVVGGIPSATATTSTFSITVTDASSSVATVSLSWQPPPSGPAVAHYKLYRGTTKGGPYPAIVGQVAAPVTTYSDTLLSYVHGISMYYVVTALTASLQESAPSNEAAVILP